MQRKPILVFKLLKAARILMEIIPGIVDYMKYWENSWTTYIWPVFVITDEVQAENWIHIITHKKACSTVLHLPPAKMLELLLFGRIKCISKSMHWGFCNLFLQWLTRTFIVKSRLNWILYKYLFRRSIPWKSGKQKKMNIDILYIVQWM